MNTPAPRPLYIEPGPVTVRARDDAILLVRPSQPDKPFPGNRVERIVSPPDADWHHAALALVMKKGIPVHWTHPRDGLTGALLPAREHPPSLAARLDAFLREADWQDRLDVWARHVRTAQYRRWTQFRMLSPAIHRQQLRADWIPHGRHPCHLSYEIRAWIHAWLDPVVASHELPRVASTGYGHSFNVIETFAPFVWAEINLSHTLSADALSEPERQTTITMVERWLHTRRAFAGDIVRSFIQFLQHQTNPWL